MTRTDKSIFDFSEQRRPGITKLAEQIKRQHPNRDDMSVLREAKEQWTQQHKKEA